MAKNNTLVLKVGELICAFDDCLCHLDGFQPIRIKQNPCECANATDC